MKTFKLWDGEIPAFTEDADCPNNVTAYLHDEGVHPAMVVFPGGAYVGRAPHEGAPIAEFYYANGFNAFVVDYRVAPNRHPAPLLDAQRAVKLVRYHAAEWGVNPNQVFGIGFSAGGHLCGSVATMADVCTVVGDAIDKMPAHLNGAVLCYPVITSIDGEGHVWSFQNLLGERFDELRYQMGVDENVTEKTCPCFLFHTFEDEGVPVANTLRMAKALRVHGIPAEIYIAPHGPHGVGLAQDRPLACEWPRLTVDWLQQLMIK